METGRPKGPRIIGLLILMLLIVIAIVFVAYQYRTPIYAEMTTLKLTPVPERFTELYFTNPSTIPTSISAGQFISFSFTISNMEGATTVYPYIVYFQNSTGGSLVLKNDEVILANNASTTIPVSYTFSQSKNQPTEQGEVIVELPSENDQQIDFYVPKNYNS